MRSGNIIEVRPFIPPTAVPANWDELTEHEYLSLVTLLVPDHGDEFRSVDFDAFRMLEAARFVLRLTPEDLAVWRADRKDEDHFLDELREVTHTALAGLMDFDEKDGVTEVRLKFNRTICPHSAISGDEVILGGPADGLENVTFLELIAAFQFYENYAQTGSEIWADRLLGCIYRPLRSVKVAADNDYRFAWRGYEHLLSERQVLFSTLDRRLKRGLLVWFLGCRSELMREFEPIFRGSAGGETAREFERFGWTAVLHEYAERLGGFNAVADLNAHTMLSKLDFDQVRLDVQQKAIEKARKK